LSPKHKPALKWPAAYIEGADPGLTLTSFEKRLREYARARDAVKLLQHDEVQSLFERVCDYRKKTIGVPEMKKLRVVERMRRFVESVRVNQPLSTFFRTLERWERGTEPWAAVYASELLEATRAAKNKFDKNWFHLNLEPSILYASRQTKKDLKPAFTLSIGRFLTKCLRTKKSGDKLLSQNQRTQYLNQLTSAVMFAAGESISRKFPSYDGARVRQQRFFASKWGRVEPDDFGGVEDYVHVPVEPVKEAGRKRRQGGHERKQEAEKPSRSSAPIRPEHRRVKKHKKQTRRQTRVLDRAKKQKRNA